MEQVPLYDIATSPPAYRDRLVGCVANFQEAKNEEIIDALSNAVVKTRECQLLDVHVTPSINRTNYSFIGPPEAVVEGAVNMALVAQGQIDMRSDPGIHPCIGALDECAFFPVRGITMKECIKCAEELGMKLGDKLQVPVYLYGFAARMDERKSLSQIRRVKYKGLKKRLEDPEWKPDFGPAEFSTWGATATGARKSLVPYNVNVLGTKEQCHDIAMDIRTSGRPGSDQPGTLKAVEAIDWWSPEYNVFQVAMNLVDIDVTPIHVAFEECRTKAQEVKTSVCGSEVVGLIPLTALLEAADFYINKENLEENLNESQKVNLAIDRLGLNSVAPFNPRKKILEYAIDDIPDLSSSILKSVMANVGSRSSAPRDCSNLLVNGAMGAAIDPIVSWILYMSAKSLDPIGQLVTSLKRDITDKLIPLVDRDTAAYTAYCSALKLPRRTEEEKATRDQSLTPVMKDSIAIPMNVAMTVNTFWDTMEKMAGHADKSDLQVGCKSMELAVGRAYYNVMMNLSDIQDERYRERAKLDIKACMNDAQTGARRVLEIIEGE